MHRAASVDLPRPALDLLAETAGVRLGAGKAAALREAVASAANARQAEAALAAADLSLISRRSLAGFGVDRPDLLIGSLRRAGRVERTGTHGVWKLPAGPWLDDSTLIASSLHVNPASRMSMGPFSLPAVMDWARRGSAGGCVNVPPGQTIPAALRSRSRRRKASLGVSRWSPKTPFWIGWGLPMFAPATEIAWIAAHPTRYNLIDLPEFLAELAENVNESELLAELDSQPRAAWMRCCVILQYGLRRDLVDSVYANAPPGTGPYYFVEHDRAWETQHEPQRAWYPRYALCDMILPAAYTLQMHRRGTGDGAPADLRAEIEAGTDGAHVTYCGKPDDLLGTA